MVKDNFSEVDMMILAKLAYFDTPGQKFYGSGEINIKLEKMVNNKAIYAELKKEFGENVVTSFKDKVGTGKYVVTKAVNDRDGTGFAALAITGPDPKTVTIATRGTEGFNFDYNSRRDVYTDSQLAHKIEANQQKKMNEFMLGMEKFDSIYMAGHSLGGNLVVSGAINFPFPGKIKGVSTFNAPGQNAAYLLINHDGIQNVKDRIINYQNQGDGVSDAMTPVGKVVVIESKIGDSWKAMFGDNHLLKTIKVENGRFIVVEEGKGLKHKMVQGVAIGLTTFICTYKFITNKYTYEFIPIAIKKVKIFLNGLFSINKNINLSSRIKVDTYKLRHFAERLESVKTRISSVDSDLNVLYLTEGLLDIINLAIAENLPSKGQMNKVINYLQDTAKEFEAAEKRIMSI